MTDNSEATSRPQDLCVQQEPPSGDFYFSCARVFQPIALEDHRMHKLIPKEKVSHI